MTQSKKTAIKGSKAPPVKGSRKVGTPDPGEKIEVVVQLRSHPGSKGLPSLEELVALPPHKQKHLTRKEFEKLHGASPLDIKKVKKFAQEYHLEVEEVDPIQRLITLSGTLKDFTAAFGVKFSHHHHPRYKKTFRTYEGEINVPEELADIVDGVFGFEDTPIFSPYMNQNGNDREDSPDSSLKEAFYPNQIAEFYHFPKEATGEGQSIAIIELGGGYDLKYLQEYFDKLEKKFNIQIDVGNITNVSVAGAKNNPGTDPEDIENYTATMETYADIEVAAAVANRAKIVVYFAPNDHKGLIKAFKLAVFDIKHDNSVISFSWGSPEPEKKGKHMPIHIKVINTILQEAAVRGITVCIGSGDSGSSDYFYPEDDLAHVDFPSSSPWALACGGTQLSVSNNEIKKETVWKHHYNKYEIAGIEYKNITVSSGGGVSDYFKCPPYQRLAGVNPKSVNPGNKSGRGVPDIAANAAKKNGYIVQFNNQTIVGGGTSIVAPLYAALIALINQKLKRRMGFLNPLLYHFGKSQIKSKNKKDGVYNDITEGNNVTAKVGGYYAQQGWDACTGWGSINGENLLKTLGKMKFP